MTILPHRNNLDIMADILLLARRGTLKTHIMYHCNLSFAQTKKHLDILLTTGLLNQQSPQYVTTSRGLEFIELYKKLSAVAKLNANT